MHDPTATVVSALVSSSFRCLAGVLLHRTQVQGHGRLPRHRNDGGDITRRFNRRPGFGKANRAGVVVVVVSMSVLRWLLVRPDTRYLIADDCCSTMLPARSFPVLVATAANVVLREAAMHLEAHTLHQQLRPKRSKVDGLFRILLPP